MKVYISVDMEGISGLVRWPDVGPAGIDFERSRRLMTADANAAIDGAFEAGATEVVVEGDQLVRIIAEDMDLGFRRVAYLGFANLPGVTRY